METCDRCGELGNLRPVPVEGERWCRACAPEDNEHSEDTACWPVRES